MWMKAALKSGMLVCLHGDCLGKMKGDGDLRIASSLIFRAAGLCPASQRVWDQLPFTLSMSFVSKSTGISCKAFGATQFGAGKWHGCTQALRSPGLSPAGQQELGR